MSTQFAVDLVFKSQTKSLNDVQRKLKQLEANLQKLNKGKPFKPIEDGAEGAGRKVDKLKQRLGGLRGALASLGAGLALKASIGGAGQLAQTELRLKSLSDEYGEFGRIQKLVAGNAKTFNQSQSEAAEGFADVYARLRPLGIELDKIQTTYEGFNAVAIANGASAQAASAAFLQLSQALGSGRLQGDEFRSIAEQVPGILRLVADEMGVTVGELKQLGSEGKITSDVLINSLAKGFDQNKDKIAELIALSPAQKFKSFQNAVSDLSDAVGKELLPVVVPMVKLLTKALRVFGKLPGPVKTLTAGIFGLAAAFVALYPAISAVAGLLTSGALAALLAAGPWIAAAAGVAAVAVAAADGTAKVRKFNDLVGNVGKDRAGITSRISDIEGRIASLGETAKKGGRRALIAKNQIKELQGALEKNKAALALLPAENKIKPPSLDLTPDLDNQKSSGEDLAKALQDSLQAGRELSTEFSRQVALMTAKDETARRLLEIDHQFEDNQARIGELLDGQQRLQLEALNADLKRLQVQEALTDAARAYNEEKLRGASYNGAEVVRLGELTESAELAAMAGKAVGDSFSNSLKSVADGTKTAQEAIADFFRSIADALLNYAATAIAQYIAIGIARSFAGLASGSVSGQSFGGFSGGSSFGVDTTGLQGPLTPFADGGIVRKPTAALIGEAGPEAVIPLSEMGKGGLGGGEVNVTTIVNANGQSTSTTEGNGLNKEQAQQLARMVEASTVGIIQRERRPGGLLAR